MREFLSGSGVPFEDRNIRKSETYRDELQERTGALAVPQLFWGERHIVGFDPDALDELVREYRAQAT